MKIRSSSPSPRWTPTWLIPTPLNWPEKWIQNVRFRYVTMVVWFGWLLLETRNFNGILGSSLCFIPTSCYSVVNRTLVVLTKLDIMDEGTNARKEMLGQVLPFKLGIVGITNRTQKDIEDNKVFSPFLFPINLKHNDPRQQFDKLFFDSHRALKNIWRMRRSFLRPTIRISPKNTEFRILQRNWARYF